MSNETVAFSAYDQVETFITRWASSSAAERANFQSFAVELCDVLGVDRPGPATGDPERDRYRFEYPVRFSHPDGSTSTGSIDLYRRDAFVMEAKQGSDQQLEEQLALFGGMESQTRKGAAVRGTRNWSIAMQGARGQAERYAKALPVDHGWPPFLIIVDVGYTFEVYADFSRTGKSYSQFPDAQRDIHERGLVSVMKHLHEQIDAAVFDAYGWPRDLSDEEILARLVELNKERRTEEAKGLVRWLRPEYQVLAAKKITVGEQGKLDIAHVPSAKAGARKASWPKTLPDRVTTIRGLLAEQPRPAHSMSWRAASSVRPAMTCRRC
jgi:hypothetical protein